jgi:hypothetical protein
MRTRSDGYFIALIFNKSGYGVLNKIEKMSFWEAVIAGSHFLAGFAIRPLFFQEEGFVL